MSQHNQTTRETCCQEIKSSLDIQTSYEPYRPRHSQWSAIDANTYDADCDQDGYFSTSPQGWGETREAAIADLLEQIEDAS